MRWLILLRIAGMPRYIILMVERNVLSVIEWPTISLFISRTGDPLVVRQALKSLLCPKKKEKGIFGQIF